jgi:hypothetical protein
MLDRIAEDGGDAGRAAKRRDPRRRRRVGRGRARRRVRHRAARSRATALSHRRFVRARRALPRR